MSKTVTAECATCKHWVIAHIDAQYGVIGVRVCSASAGPLSSVATFPTEVCNRWGLLGSFPAQPPV